jgi:hypothetical protein
VDQRRKVQLQLDLIRAIVRRESQRLAPDAVAEIRSEALRIVAVLEGEVGEDEEMLRAIRATRDDLV